MINNTALIANHGLSLIAY